MIYWGRAIKIGSIARLMAELPTEYGNPCFKRRTTTVGMYSLDILDDVMDIIEQAFRLQDVE